MWRAAALAVGLWAATTAAADAPACRTGTFEDLPFTVCEADPSAGGLRLWHKDAGGTLIGSFARLEDILAERGERAVFAMNGAMYHPDRAPVGLYIEGGKTLSPIALRAGPGNFGLLPNGVFCLSGGAAAITESRAFAKSGKACDFAMQSGPLLVSGGALHPQILPNSRSAFIRNGIGLRPDGTVLAVISDAPVNFHRFARLFRDDLGAPDALFVDGNTSRLYAPGLARSDIGFQMGPILALAVPRDGATN